MAKEWKPSLKELPSRHFCSFDSLIQPDLDNETLNLSDNSDFRDEIDKKYLLDGIKAILNTLSEREKLVVLARFGFLSVNSLTLDSVGKEFNITRERIRQIEIKALRKLRHESRSKPLAHLVQNSVYDKYVKGIDA